MSGDWIRLDEDHPSRLADEREWGFPLPTRIFSNGEWTPPPQTVEQRAVERTVEQIASRSATRLGISRRRFLRSSLGLAAGFAALNGVFGPVFALADDEVEDAEAAMARRIRFADQYIFDGHLHFVHEDYGWEGLLPFRQAARMMMKAEGMPERMPTFEDLRFANFVKEVFFDSDTTAGIVSTATSDDPAKVFLTNPQIRTDVDRFNAATGTQRLYGHAAFHPGTEGWLEKLDEVIATMPPLSWKGYTIGDPLGPSAHPWRLDDEQLVYPAYERMVKAGITTVCIHKGLVPATLKATNPSLYAHANVDDVGQAAKDWPQLNFVIYHAALEPAVFFAPAFEQRFEETGRMDWASDLADIPERFGVTNVWADVGTSFGQGAITKPRLAAALMGILIRGLGEDRVVWGTDAVWWGSPQWQIEAFRRITMPPDLVDRFGLPELGEGDGPLKTRIFGTNSADLYGFGPEQRTVAHHAGDRLAKERERYLAAGEDRSNIAYGFVPDEG